jgi:rare lipoprotein A
METSLPKSTTSGTLIVLWCRGVCMNVPLLIKSLVFTLVFLAVMSVSFLVEAHDIPEGAGVYAAQPAEIYGPPMPVVTTAEMIDIQDGVASWYGEGFHGRRTASGRPFDMHAYTAAHRDLPFGSIVRVMNPTTGQRVVVEITDRGPFIRRRVLDLSKAAAGRVGVSVTKVDLQVLRPSDVAAFYAGNANSVLVVTPDMDVQVRPAITLSCMTSMASYADAMKRLRNDEVVVVMTKPDGTLQFSIGEPLPIQLAMQALSSIQ